MITSTAFVGDKMRKQYITVRDFAELADLYFPAAEKVTRSQIGLFDDDEQKTQPPQRRVVRDEAARADTHGRK